MTTGLGELHVRATSFVDDIFYQVLPPAASLAPGRCHSPLLLYIVPRSL